MKFYKYILYMSFIFFILIFGLFSEQHHYDINKAEYNEKYEVYVYNTDNYQVVWYKNKIKKAEGSLKNNERNGFWKFWYDNGKLKAEGEYTQNKMNGYWKLYYTNGSIFSEGNYKDNKKEGEWKFYYPDGKIKSIGNYASGLRNGEWKEYYDNGQLFFKGNYSNDLANGHWTYYFNDGSFYQAGKFEDDVRTGEWKICIHPNGMCNTEIYDNKSPPPLSNLPKVDDPSQSKRFSDDISNPAKILESFEK